MKKSLIYLILLVMATLLLFAAPVFAAAPDADLDGVSDARDNCPLTYNPGQENADSDIYGDACEGDFDRDDVIDAEDCAPNDSTRYDEAGLYDDKDGDGITYGVGASFCIGLEVPAGWLREPNGFDNCPAVSNPDQADTDQDGVGDACETDDSDHDGVLNGNDCVPDDIRVTLPSRTKACQLYLGGVAGKGILTGAGLRNAFNPKAQAGSTAGKKTK